MGDGTEIGEQICDIIFNKQWDTSVRVLSDTSSIKYQLVPLSLSLSLALCLRRGLSGWDFSQVPAKFNVNTRQTSRDTQVINYNWLLSVIYVKTDNWQLTVLLSKHFTLSSLLLLDRATLLSIVSSEYWHKDTIWHLDIYKLNVAQCRYLGGKYDRDDDIIQPAQ